MKLTSHSQPNEQSEQKEKNSEYGKTATRFFRDTSIVKVSVSSNTHDYKHNNNYRENQA